MSSKKLLACIDDGAYISAATVQAFANAAESLLWTAVYAAGMAAKRKAAGEIAAIEAALNKRRLALAKKITDHAKKGDSVGGSLVSAAIAEPNYTPLYGPAQSMIVEGAVREEHARVLSNFTLNRVGITLNQCDLARVARGMAIGRTDMVSHTMRAGEARAVALNDRRRSRANSATGLGRGAAIPPLSVGGSATASMNGVVDSIARTFNSGMALWGYASNRNSYGGNFVTGQNQAPTVVPSWVGKVNTDTPAEPTVNVVVEAAKTAPAEDQSAGYDYFYTN